MILLTYNNEEERILDCFEKNIFGLWEKLFGLCLDCLLLFIKLLLTSCTSSEIIYSQVGDDGDDVTFFIKIHVNSE